MLNGNYPLLFLPFHSRSLSGMIAAALKDSDLARIQSIFLQNHFQLSPSSSNSISLLTIPTLSLSVCIDPVISHQVTFWNSSVPTVAPLSFAYDSSPLSLFSNAGTPYKEMVLVGALQQQSTLGVGSKVNAVLECKCLELGDFTVWIGAEDGKNLVLVVVRHSLGIGLLERALVHELLGNEEGFQIGEAFGLEFLKAQRFI